MKLAQSNFRFERDSIGELLSSLGAAASENLASVLGSHSLSEAVLLLALDLLRLIRSEHLFRPPYLIHREALNNADISRQTSEFPLVVALQSSIIYDYGVICQP